MKYTFFIISLFFTINLNGQTLSEKVGEIEIELIGQQYLRNSDFELTKKKTNRKNRPFEKIYLDETGQILKKVNFGKHHNTDLRLTDDIKVYLYNNQKLSEIILYESDYEKRVLPFTKTKLNYSDSGQLIDSTSYFLSDSSLQKISFEYDKKSNKTKTIFQSGYYLERDFDSLNRIKSLKQIFENKLRWEWNYTYNTNQRIGIFQTYYKDDSDYSTKEIVTFNGKGYPIEIEEKQVSRDGLNEKEKFFYLPNGILQRIEKHQSFSNSEEYKLLSFTVIKVKTKLALNERVIRKIYGAIVAE